jgi:methylmalonyl-CoA mutase
MDRQLCNLQKLLETTEEEKQFQIQTKKVINTANRKKKVAAQIAILQEAAIQNENLFDKLMETTSSLG